LRAGRKHKGISRLTGAREIGGFVRSGSSAGGHRLYVRKKVVAFGPPTGFCAETKPETDGISLRACATAGSGRKRGGELMNFRGRFTTFTVGNVGDRSNVFFAGAPQIATWKISSSVYFPRFDRKLKYWRKSKADAETEWSKAANVIFHDKDHSFRP